MISSKLFIALSISLVLLACSTESRKKGNFIQGQATDFEKVAGTTFRVDTFTSADVQVSSKNKHGIATKKSYTLSACLQGAGNTALGPDLAFIISDGSDGLVKQVTNVKGCLVWNEVHAFPMLSNERYFKLTRIISSANYHKGAVKVVVAFNPWNDQKAILDTRLTTLPAGASFVDVGPLSVNGASLKPNANEKLSVNVEQLSFEFQGLDFSNYKISRSLNLTVAHKYLIAIKPTVIRNTIAKLGVSEALVGGKMKMYLALFRETPEGQNFDLNNLIQVSETVLVDSNNSGRFIAQTSVQFDNISDISSRTQALVTLVPDDEENMIGELRFSGVLKAGRLSNLALVPAEQSAYAMYAVAQQKQDSAFNLKPFDLFVSESDYKEINTDVVLGRDMATGGWFSRSRPDVHLASELSQFLSAPANATLSTDVERALCTKLYPQGQVKLTNCLRQPSDYVAYGKREFIDEVTSAPRLLGPTTTETMSMEMAISASKTRATSSAKKVSGGLGLSLGVGSDHKFCMSAATEPGKPCVTSGTIFKPITWLVSTIAGSIGLKANIGADYAWSRTWTSADNESNTVSVRSGATVTSEGNTFEFKALAKSCVLINEKLSDQTETAPKAGLFYCQNDSREKVLTESYYLVGQNIGIGGSPFSDSESSSSTQWRTFVRGRTTALMLYSLIKDSRVRSVLERGESAEQSMYKKFQDYTMMQEFPGALKP
jgi:hypothetical protein